MTIALLCPTKGRREQFSRMCKSAAKTSDHHRIYVAISFDDIREYNGLFGGAVDARITPDMMPTAHKWNILAKTAMEDPNNKLFMLASDDMVFSTPLWDHALLEHYNALDNKVHVYSLQDSRDPEGTPHPIVTREWVEFWGYMVNPIWLHWYIDTWAVTVAKHAGCFTHLKDYLLVHDKGSDIGKPDATHIGIRSQGWPERDKFVWEKTKHYLELDKQILWEKMHGQN